MNSKKKIREFVLLEKSTPRKDRSFQNETIKYEIVFVIERNSYS